MRAVAYAKALPASDENCLLDVVLDRPESPTAFQCPAILYDKNVLQDC